MSRIAVSGLAWAWLGLTAQIHGQGTAADYERAASLRRLTRDKVVKASVDPHWLAGNTRFWYRNVLPRGRTEYVLVDVAGGMRQPAFDHVRLARSLRDAGVADATAGALPLAALTFERTGKTILFRAGGKGWRCDLQTCELTAAELEAESIPTLAPRNGPRASVRSGPETMLTFANTTTGVVELFWLDGDGVRRSYGMLAAGDERDQHTYAGHVWLVVNEDGRELGVYEAPELPGRAEIGAADGGRRRPGPRERPESGRRRRRSNASPDGKWRAFTRDQNLGIVNEETGEEFMLSRNGTPENSYDGEFFWSSDSTKLVAMQTRPAESRTVHVVESSPRDQLQPKLHSFDYLKPGDRVAVSTPHLFDVASRTEIAVSDKRFPNPWSISGIRWQPDSSRFTFLYNQRGHQVLRIVAVDAASGATTAIVNEECATFFDYSSKLFVRYLDETNEVLWMSERDGWNHLYLYDSRTGEVKNQVTKGEWVVRGVDRVDTERRQIWFRAGGIDAEQDPYYVHHCRINFDGGGLVRLTAGDGMHSVRYSPDGEYLIDTWSRVDLPPVTELRRTDDGAIVCELEQGDWSELVATGWQPPERFKAKGRDGVTDIYGVIYRPTNFDATNSYPVIEAIYAGPQGSHVPKEFAPLHGPQELAELGFIVVQIDGMGTNHRSKAFHDVCWKNLGDAGFPDRMAWMKAAAAMYPCLDLTRVGIYGVSAGGQNALGGALQYPDFYKACVAACGCHDNRMDKIWWNELWMGWPVGDHYAAQSNVTLAKNLRGRLLLIVGELDHNVDPASTMQVVHALIEADKDFDLVVVPGAGHGMGGAYGERRMRDFFVRELLGVRPPERNGE